MFAPGHIGELTRIVPFEVVDAVLAQTRAVQRRVRLVPARVTVYVLLAGALFTGLGYRQVFDRLCAGLAGLALARPSSSALRQARQRLGPEPMKALFDLVRGPAATTAAAGWWRGLRVVAVDGTLLSVPDCPANLQVFTRQRLGNRISGYPQLRPAALVACGTRSVIGATFGPAAIGELECTVVTDNTVPAAPLLPPQFTGDASAAVAARAAMIAQLDERGELGRGPVRVAVLTLPRQIRMPQAHVRRSAPDEMPPCWDLLDFSRPADREELLERLHGGDSVAVQHGGEPLLGRVPGPRCGGVMTAMSSTMRLTAGLLQQLDLRPGQRVLDVGTGAGVTAAAVCSVCGDEGVVTLDIDPHVTAAARERLSALGYRAAAVTGDGTTG